MAHEHLPRDRSAEILYFVGGTSVAGALLTEIDDIIIEMDEEQKPENDTGCGFPGCSEGGMLDCDAPRLPGNADAAIGSTALPAWLKSNWRKAA